MELILAITMIRLIYSGFLAWRLGWHLGKDLLPERGVEGYGEGGD